MYRDRKEGNMVETKLQRGWKLRKRRGEERS
jgi:hypothetical protein